MAKQLRMGHIQSIIMLHQYGYSNRRIAELPGTQHEIAAKHLDSTAAVPAKPDPRV